jgi:translation initiation factor 2B subunit (eIF-2B alpha/beta/delta family)
MWAVMVTQEWDSIESRIQAIRDDHRSGSLGLTRKAGAVLAQLAECETGGARQWRRLVAACRGLVAAQPEMASIVNLCSEVLTAVDSGGRTRGPIGPVVRAAVERFLKRLEGDARTAAVMAAGLLKDGTRVMTHSYSSMVRDALLCAAATGARLHVLVTESRPLREGVALAKRLAEDGIAVTLGVDAALAALVSEADLVLVGADAVRARGVVNKIGTLPAVLAARERNRPCYALAVKEKFVAGAVPIGREEDKDPAEIVRRVPVGVRVYNRYFEETPLEWFAGVVTEEGVLTADEVRRRLRRLRVHRSLAVLEKERARRSASGAAS